MGLVEPLVADGGAFGIIVDAERLAGIVAAELGARQLVDRGREGRGQMARRVDFAAEHAGDGRAATGAGEPGFDDRAGLVEPRHGHRAARFEHDDGLGIGLGDGGNQSVLAIRQAQIRHIHALGGPLGGEDDDDVALGGQLRRRGNVLAVIIGDGCLGAFLQFLHRRGRIVDHRPREMIRAFIGHDQAAGRGAVRIDLGRAAAGQHAGIGMAADDGDGLGRLRQGQQAVVVL